MRIIIPVESGDALAAVRGFLKRLLEAEVVEAVLVPMETPAGTITPALVADPDLLDAANPLAPVMGLNAARVAGHVSIREPRGRIGAVLRSCELRALVELVKLQQASLEDLVTIGVDCLGTYDVAVYNAMRADGGVDLAAYLATARSGELVPQEGYAFRDGCQMCELFGADLSAGIPVTLPDEMAEKLGLSPAEEDGRRAEVVEKVVAARTRVRDEEDGRRAEVVEKVVAARTRVRDARFAEMRQRLDQEGIEGVFAACVRCRHRRGLRCLRALP